MKVKDSYLQDIKQRVEKAEASQPSKLVKDADVGLVAVAENWLAWKRGVCELNAEVKVLLKAHDLSCTEADCPLREGR